MAIDWAAGGYAVRAWHARVVDPATWAEAGELAGVRSMTVERSCEGDAPLLESAEVVLDADVGSEPFSGWLRLTATVEQAGQVERVDMATVWCERTSGDVERGMEERTLAGHSVLWPCSKSYAWDVSGGYAPAGSDGAELAARMIAATTTAPVSVEGGFTVDGHVVFDQDATVLDAAWLLLRAGGYRMRLSGDGRIAIGPDPTEPSLELDSASASILVPRLGIDADTTGVPNVYRAQDGTEVAVAVNDDPSSPVSTESRGWRHVMRDDSPVRVNGETLAAYAARRLEEESTISRSLSYSREWWPGVAAGDIVRGSLASVGLDGDMRVTRQRVECALGMPVEEEASMEVRLWQRS